MTQYIAALDQGTTSTRCIIFDRSGKIISSSQKEHAQIYPKPGWVEHDALEIWENAQEVFRAALAEGGLSLADIAALGITNQRETTVVWDKATGQPIYNALVWQDTRTDKICTELAKEEGQERFRPTVGLPLATYFSGPKITWLLDNVEGARERAERGELLFGNIDTWLAWNMSGGPKGGRHVTDVTNASRTMLMDLKTLSWDEEILGVMNGSEKALGIPKKMLPEICSSSEVYAAGTGVFKDLPIAGILGDQQAALFGQTCFEAGSAKNTYGTGCFMLLNTGTKPILSENGLLTTLAYKLGDRAPVYALEGSIAITGALVQWLRDNLGLIKTTPEIETLAATVNDNGGIYFVPAFSGLFAPYWRSDARGAIVGLTRYINKGHIARATLEATAYQTKEVLEAMEGDSGVALKSLKVDGGMVQNEFLMQFQADMLNVPVIRPTVAETTSLGAAYAAGLAVGYWEDQTALKANWSISHKWMPAMEDSQREKLFKGWKKAVTRTFDWM